MKREGLSKLRKLTLIPQEAYTLRLPCFSGKVLLRSSNPRIISIIKGNRLLARKPGKAVVFAGTGQNALRFSVTVKKNRWSRLLSRYQKNPLVNQLIFVKYTGRTNAKVCLYQKALEGWELLLECPGYVGKEGIGKIREGDQKTPVGVFRLTRAFGIKDNPGAGMEYVKLNPYLYWCGDEQYYNQLIDIREKPHDCSGEHLIEFPPHYNYGMFTDFNRECIYDMGSAIFFHCFGPRPYTGGCVAVSEKDMIRILQKTEPGARICIYRM